MFKMPKINYKPGKEFDPERTLVDLRERLMNSRVVVEFMNSDFYRSFFKEWIELNMQAMMNEIVSGNLSAIEIKARAIALRLLQDLFSAMKKEVLNYDEIEKRIEKIKAKVQNNQRSKL